MNTLLLKTLMTVAMSSTGLGDAFGAGPLSSSSVTVMEANPQETDVAQDEPVLAPQSEAPTFLDDLDASVDEQSNEPVNSAPVANPVLEETVSKKPKLVVMDLVAQDVDPAVNNAIAQAVSAQAIKSHPGEVVTSEQIRLTLDASAARLLLGCDDAGCLADVAAQVEGDVILGGSVNRVGNDLIMVILLVDARTGKGIASEERKVPAYEDLYYYAARQMVSLVLTGHSVDSTVPVRIEASEPAATIMVDGRDVGLTPQTIQLDPGEHEIIVLADGFIAWKNKIQVIESHPQTIEAVLVSDGVRLWPLAAAMAGMSAVSAIGGGLAGAVALELYNGSIGILPEAADESFAYAEPTTTAELSRKRANVQTAALITEGLLLFAAVSGGLAAATFAADMIGSNAAE